MIRVQEKNMKDVTPAELSKAEAQELTTRIKGAVDGLWKLLVKAREGKAFKALGYETWEAYVKAEFGMSRSYAHRVMQQGEVVEAIEDAVGDLSPIGNIPEGVARELKDDLPANASAIRERVEQGEKPEDAAKDIAAKKRAAKAAKPEPHPQEPKVIEPTAEPVPTHDAEAAEDDEDTQALKDRIDELEEHVRAVEAEEARLKAKLAELEYLKPMHDDWKGGGWDEVIRKLEANHADSMSIVTQGRDRESADKVGWMNDCKAARKSRDYWKEQALKHGAEDPDLIIVER